MSVLKNDALLAPFVISKLPRSREGGIRDGGTGDRRAIGEGGFELKGSLNEEKLQHFCGFFPNWYFWLIFSLLLREKQQSCDGPGGARRARFAC